MRQTALALTLGREDLSDLIASGSPSGLEPVALAALGDKVIGQKQIIAGYWAKPDGDPFPDFLAVRDDDYEDTQAWLSAFLSGFSPVSQWCRVWRLSELARVEKARTRPSLGSLTGSWIGAILAEYASQGSSANLKEVSGAAVLTGANYCAARALAVWDGFDTFEELAKRHDAVAGRREANRLTAAEHYIPLWYVLAGDRWEAKAPAEARALDFIRRLVSEVAKVEFLTQDNITEITRALSREYRLPDLERCGTGPQGQRVDALDRLAEQLLAGPRSVTSSALMGFGASLIDPGAAVLPELLRRYAASIPGAAVWAGAFAGMWFPVRVLSEHGGLGRIVSKEVLAPSDIFSKPSADIGFDELSRWTGGSFANAGKVPVRGLMARSLFVELVPGVVLPVPAARPDAARAEPYQPVAGKQQTLDLGAAGPPADANKRKMGSDTSGANQDLAIRIERLEQAIAELMGKAPKGLRSGTRPRVTRS